MFDLGWSKLIIIAMLAIVVVGPKDLPALLRTIGKFVGQIRRQADEFRQQFNEAMKDTELDQIRKDVEDIKRSAVDSVRDIEASAADSVKPFEAAASDITDLGGAQSADAGATPAATPVPADVAASIIEHQTMTNAACAYQGGGLICR
jgi:sec-independent protein translocase protein TatB